MGFDVISEAVNSFVTKVDLFIDSFINDFWNVVDNDYMSMDKNVNRVTGFNLSQNISADIPVGADILIFIPLAVILGALNLGIGIWYARLKRDAWDAYWEKEGEKLDRIKKALNKDGEIELVPLSNDAQPKPLSARRQKLLEKIAKRLKGYQKDTVPFIKEIEEYKRKCSAQYGTTNPEKFREKEEEIATLEAALNNLHSKLTDCNDWSELKPVWDRDTVSPRPIDKKKKVYNYVSMLSEKNSEASGIEAAEIINEPETANNAQQAPEPTFWGNVKNKLLGFIKDFSDSSIFATAFAYAWGYWFVFFFTVWGLPEYSPFTTVPVEFGLFALICPAIYLIYKEYVAYKKSLLINEDLLTEEEKKELEKKCQENAIPQVDENSPLLASAPSVEQPEILRLRKVKEILDKRAKPFRFGWILIALIAAITVGAICGLPIVGAVFAGIGVFVGVLLVVYGVTHFIIDEQAKTKRAQLLKEAEDEITRAQQPQQAQLLDNDEEVSNPGAANDPLVNKKVRKKWADDRKYALKEIEYLVACLKQEEALEALAQEVLNAEQLKAYAQDQETLRNKKRKLLLIENDEALEKAKSKAEKARDSQLRRAKIYQCIAAGLDFLTGYMFACLLGFAIFDFLGNVLNVALLGTGVFTIPVLVCAIIVGVVGLLTASSHAYRSWTTREEENTEFKKKFDEQDYQNKQIELLHFTKQAKELRNDLKKRLEQNKDSFTSEQLDALNQLLNKPAKERPWTVRRFVKGLRNFVYIITSISTVALIARAILTMGFLAAVPVLAGSSLVIFAAVSNPFGIAVLSIAAALLLLRLARQLYLSVQQARALQNAEHIDLKLEKRKNEIEHLEKVQLLLDQKIPQLAANGIFNDTGSEINVPRPTPVFVYKDDNLIELEESFPTSSSDEENTNGQSPRYINGLVVTNGKKQSGVFDAGSVTIVALTNEHGNEGELPATNGKDHTSINSDSLAQQQVN